MVCKFKINRSLQNDFLWHFLLGTRVFQRIIYGDLLAVCRVKSAAGIANYVPVVTIVTWCNHGSSGTENGALIDQQERRAISL